MQNKEYKIEIGISRVFNGWLLHVLGDEDVLEGMPLYCADMDTVFKKINEIFRAGGKHQLLKRYN